TTFDVEREGGPQEPACTGAEAGRRGICRAAERGGRDYCGDLGRAVGGRASRGRRELFRLRGTLAAGDTGGVAGAGCVGSGAGAAADIRVADGGRVGGQSAGGKAERGAEAGAGKAGWRGAVVVRATAVVVPRSDGAR